MCEYTDVHNVGVYYICVQGIFDCFEARNLTKFSLWFLLTYSHYIFDQWETFITDRANRAEAARLQNGKTSLNYLY